MLSSIAPRDGLASFIVEPLPGAAALTDRTRCPDPAAAPTPSCEPLKASTASPRTEADELAEFFIGEFGQRHLVSGERPVSDRAPVAQQLADVVLDRVLDDEVVRMDRLMAPDAVGAIGDLVFHGGFECRSKWITWAA